MRNLLERLNEKGVMAACLLSISAGAAEAQVAPATAPAVNPAYPAGSVPRPRMYSLPAARSVDGQVTGAVPGRANQVPGNPIRQVQAEAGAQPPAPATHPPAATGETPNPAAIEPGAPGSNTSDLSLPASERAFGGGEPTTSAAEAETAAAEGEKKDARGLLMKALGAPEDSDWKIYGWIQNSYTGNMNGRGNGFNFGVNPNFKANEWMGNQYYLIFEKPLKQNDEINFGFRMDNLFGNDWQFNYMQGF